jgi:Surface antigen variable number repeat
MKGWLLALVLFAGVDAQPQTQAACPGPRRDAPTSTCSSVDGKGEITVHVSKIDTGSESLGDRSKIGTEALFDAVGTVEKHQYRACDIGKEIVERVIDSLQRLGYFCADVEPIHAQQIGKNEYRIAIHAHPGSQYRLKEVTFSGATMLSTDELRSAFHMKPNSVVDTEAVRRGLQILQKAYAKKGRPNMTAVPSVTLEEAGRAIALDIAIQEGAASAK